MVRRSCRKRKAPFHSGAPEIQPVPSSARKRKAPIPSGVPAIQPAHSLQPLNSNLNVPVSRYKMFNRSFSEKQACASPHQQKRYLAPGKSYHWFISYKDTQGENMWVKNLISTLQNYGFICLDHSTEFQAGKNIFRNIEAAVESSMKTLVVLSRNYMDSEFCRYELDCIRQRSLASKENLIIPVLQEKCKIPECLKLVTYVDATGYIEQWMPKIIKAFERKDVGQPYLLQLNPFSYYRNLDTVHEEVTRILFRRLAFDSRRYMPKALNDPSTPISIESFHKVLDTLSRSNFIKCGFLYILQPITICCVLVALLFYIFMLLNGFIYLMQGNWLLATDVINFFMFAVLSIMSSYLHYGNRIKRRQTLNYPWISSYSELILLLVKSDRKILKACCYGFYVTLIYFILHVILLFATSQTLKIGIYSFLIVLTATFPWFYFWYKHQSEDLKKNVLIDINRELTNYNLLLTYTVDACFSRIYIVFVYFDSKACLNYIETSLRKQVTNNYDTDFTVRYRSAPDTESRDMMIKDEALQLFLDLSSDYLKDFFDEKLENSNFPRHTTRAICLCEYAEKGRFIVKPG